MDCFDCSRFIFRTSKALLYLGADNRMLQFQNFVPIDANTDLEAIISVKFGGMVGSVVI